MIRLQINISDRTNGLNGMAEEDSYPKITFQYVPQGREDFKAAYEK
jgi:hypothetical protein